MTKAPFSRGGWLRGALAGVAVACSAAPSALASPTELDALLGRTSDQVAAFLDQFSDVQCIEEVSQEKLGKDDKVEQEQASTYHYLVILTNVGGEVSVDESRQAVREPKPGKASSSPMLVSNGFAMLFLVFHPYYAVGFEFTALEDQVVAGQRLRKVAFRHLRGRRSPVALELRGREYPLDLSGAAWINPQTGVITRIVASVEDTMEDVGVKTLRADLELGPVPFHDMKLPYWFPVKVNVEVETPRQHWRNIHRFTEYRRFSVSTEEQVTTK